MSDSAYTIVIGSGNRDKARELAELLADTPFNVKSAADFPAVPAPEETADTFEGNALEKAAYYAERFGLPVVADDSGLEVDALNGAPGVYSARYAGEGCTYDDNNRKLLAALQGVPDDRRSARFVCCAAYVDGEGASHVVRGTVAGRIATAPEGTKGFGYDPLFVPDGYDRTFAEMDADEKHAISHRGRAFEQLKDYLVGLMTR